MKLTLALPGVGWSQAALPSRLARSPHVSRLGARRRMEDDDVADLRVAEALADAVDEHALADLEGRDHRLARDPVRLDEEGLDPERQAERDRDDQDQLEERAARRLLLASSRLVVGGGLAAAGASAWASPSASAGAASAGAASSAAAATGSLPSPVVSGSAAASAAPPASTTSAAVSPSASIASVAAAASASSTSAGSCSSPGVDHLLGADVAALADTGTLADAVAQVVELRAPHVTAGGDLDLLDLRRVHRERALHADAEGLLADREGLARAVALALDDHALEDLRTTTRALDDLEVDADAVAGLELGYAAQLGALEVVDDGAHGEKTARGSGSR